MELRKLIVSFILIIFLLHYKFQIICNATEEYETVILNDIVQTREVTEEITNNENIEETNGLNIYSESAILMDATTRKSVI